MGRYNFSPDEIQRRAAMASELKKKSKAGRAAKGEKDGPKKAAAATKKAVVAAAPVIDRAAERQAASDRRMFLAGSALFTGAIVTTLGGANRFSFPRMLFEPPTVFEAGKADEYIPGSVSDRFLKTQRTWIIRTADRIYALSGRCTHLGCTPAWLPADGKFKCPCHGSGFRMTGVNFEGPAPRALERFRIWMSAGRMMVDTSKLFVYETGDWEKPESFILV